MSSILSIALSGMLAATERLQVSAQKVANARSDGPLPTASAALQAQYPPAYVPQRVDQVDVAGGGTRAIVTAVQPSTVAVSDPSAPYADANGQVAQPNVDDANEAIQQTIARTELAANAQVVRIYAKMMQTLSDIET